MALISETYLTKPELKVTEESRQIVKAFLGAGKRATSEQYRKARTVILTTQSAVLEGLQDVYYPKFKQSDLYYKYLALDDGAHSSGVAVPSPSSQQTPVGTLEIRERRPLPPLMNRTTSHPGSKPKKDLRRAAISSNDVPSLGKLFDDEEPARGSIDSERSVPLFDDDYDTDPLSMSTQSLNRDTPHGESENSENRIIENMEAALNDIITNEPKHGKLEELPSNDLNQKSPRSSTEIPIADGRDDRLKPSIASLGLLDGTSRRGVFDDDLFPEQQKYLEDEYEEPEGADAKDSADEVHEAAPGDLGLTEAIQALTTDIEKLGSQEAVVDTLTRKAELTNNTAELRILRKSKTSIQRELHRKDMQRQQYMIQESDNSLYGRSSIRIKSIVVGKEEDGREFALCMLGITLVKFHG